MPSAITTCLLTSCFILLFSQLFLEYYVTIVEFSRSDFSSSDKKLASLQNNNNLRLINSNKVYDDQIINYIIFQHHKIQTLDANHKQEKEQIRQKFSKQQEQLAIDIEQNLIKNGNNKDLDKKRSIQKLVKSVNTFSKNSPLEMLTHSMNIQKDNSYDDELRHLISKIDYTNIVNNRIKELTLSSRQSIIEAQLKSKESPIMNSIIKFVSLFYQYRSSDYQQDLQNLNQRITAFLNSTQDLNLQNNTQQSKNSEYQELRESIENQKILLQNLDQNFFEKKQKIFNETLDQIENIDYLRKKKSEAELSAEFSYSYLNNLVKNSTFTKIFEIDKDEDYFYIFTQNNQKVNRQNLKNPFYSEISLSRVNQESYLEMATNQFANFDQNNQNRSFESHVLNGLPQICLHDFIPGTVQKIAFDQVDNKKVALLYRMLVEKGFLYRLRIYDFTKNLSCTVPNLQKNNFDNILTYDDIEENFDNLRDNYEDFFFDENQNVDFQDTEKQNMEDFVFPTHTRVTALNFYGGDTVTYSQNPDFYEYRILKKKLKSTQQKRKVKQENNKSLSQQQSVWEFEKFGPFIDKQIDQVYICTGLHYIQMSSNFETEMQENNRKFGEFIVVVSLKGKDSENLNLTATGHMQLKEDDLYQDSLFKEDERVGWYQKNIFKTINFKISQALDVFSHEVQQKDLTYFTQVHPTNQILNLFGHFFLSLDWDYDKERLYGFETFKDGQQFVDLVASLPDNSRVLFYTHNRKKIYNLKRQKKNDKFDKVYEYISELKLQSIFPNFNSLQIGKQKKQETKISKFIDNVIEDKDIEEYDNFDQMMAYLYKAISKFYNPIERIQNRNNIAHLIVNNINQYINGDNQSIHQISQNTSLSNKDISQSNSILKLQSQEEYIQKESSKLGKDKKYYYIDQLQKLNHLSAQDFKTFEEYQLYLSNGLVIPKEIEKTQIVEMYYKYDKKRNQTVLLTLMHGGIISSFQIEKNFHIQKREPSKDLVQKAINNTGQKPKSKKKLDIIQSLIQKIIDEAEQIVNSDDYNYDEVFQSGDFYNQLDQEELQVLEEIIDQIEFYVEFIGPFLLILIPCCICWMRNRIANSRLRNQQQIIEAQQRLQMNQAQRAPQQAAVNIQPVDQVPPVIINQQPEQIVNLIIADDPQIIENDGDAGQQPDQQDLIVEAALQQIEIDQQNNGQQDGHNI